MLKLFPRLQQKLFASHRMGKKPKAAAVSPSKVPLPPSFTADPAPKKTQPLSPSENEDEESDDDGSSGSNNGDELGSEAEDRNGEHVSEDEELGESGSVSSNDDSDGNDAEEEMKNEKMASPEDEAEDEEEIALDDHDGISIDEDAVPKQKVVIDNKVRFRSLPDGV